MKYIQKEQEPVAFIDWKNQHQANFNSWASNGKKLWDYLHENGFQIKQILRNALFQEQGSVCCYCNQLIDIKRTKIDHIQPQQKYPHKIFDYTNILLSCNGNEQAPKPRDLHCDALKKNNTIPIDPLQTNCEQHFFFRLNGEIAGSSDDGITTINILGLDNRSLTLLRKAVIDEEMKETKTKEHAIQRIDELQKKIHGQYQQFSIAIIKILKTEFNI